MHLAKDLCSFHYHRNHAAATALLSCTVNGCDLSQFQTGLCHRHYHRQHTYGDLEQRRIPQRERSRWLWWAVFVCLVTRTEECILQPFGTDSTGYGAVHWASRKVRMHQAVLMLTGRVPPRKGDGDTRHLCGVHLCVNPFHIVVGTQKENGEDSVRHGTAVRGEAHIGHKLTEADVRTIRASGERQVVLAGRYGIDPSTVSQIRSRKRWKHVED